MKHIVTSIRYGPSEADNAYYAVSLDSFSMKEFKSPSFAFSLFDMVEADGEKVNFVSNGAIAREELEEKVMELCKHVLKESSPSGIAGLDKITEKMKEKMRSAAHLLAMKLYTSAPIVVRFHNDTDGSSGAYCLFKSISEMLGANGIKAKPSITWRMHGGIAYSKADAEHDILYANGFSSIEKPLLVIIDFGTSKDSNEGIEALSNKFDIIWLDHHPIEEGFLGTSLEHYINPWGFGGDSEYTAGFLACEFSKYLSSFDVHDMECASLIGDFSTFARNEERASKLALLLELITSDKRVAFKAIDQNLTPAEIDSILYDKKKFEELVSYASTKMDEALDSAMHVAKVYKGENVDIYVADFKKVRGEDLSMRYPLPGRFASKLVGKIEELSDKPVVLLLHFGGTISIRQSRALNEKVDLTKVAKAAKESMHSVSAAGGHKSAISIRFADEESKKEAMQLLISIIKDEISNAFEKKADKPN